MTLLAAAAEPRARAPRGRGRAFAGV